MRSMWGILHWRLAVAVAIGVLGALAAPLISTPPDDCLLVGWVIGAGAYVALLWRLFLTTKEAEVRARASREDESRVGLLLIVLALIGASLVAIVATLINARHDSAETKIITAALAGVTLILCWAILQSIFVLHYAHRHFGDIDRDGLIDGGFTFPGEPASTYMDFVYLSFCIGATFQVSDTTVMTLKLRNLITAHAALAYFYNTAILALGINIIAGLVGSH
jgi:uncharacterized membrane protein